ncbi:MAG TPA: MEKHLA domain-containing protein [Cyanobacteria bacterium UBA11369]|nr:MEKHLA domain-containing protein [Cyanobacteria bacterium UBA11371]HBE35924.1 MEKHLA domain-containing protein [Cyanobacteria bacterium UBA11368]HBE52185.1 MEKHLA domain-containing protein [Cyanobacteria bacterium UBA11369]
MNANILFPWQQEELIRHSQRILNSFQHWAGHSLIEVSGSPLQIAEALFEAPFPVYSHGTEPDPIFNYGNRKALALMELDWEQLTQMPSRYSAESIEREERSRLLNEVTTKGYVTNGRGIRISRTGKRYMVSDFTVWNLLDENHQYCGQAARFTQWTPLENRDS